MAPEAKAECELEIAHVLFIDAVGYSKLAIDEQREWQNTLNRVVRSTDRFRVAESTGRLIRLPTGDGMALIFSDSPESPAESAVEISKALKSYPQLAFRMGIHSGPVSRVVDVNDRSNVAGAGINIAERVMSCGDAGHILLSKRAAEDLAEYGKWRPHLHEIGEFAFKHGTRVRLVNFYNDEVGNAELPKRFEEDREEESHARPSRFFSRRIWFVPALIGIAMLALAGYFLHGKLRSSSKSAADSRPATSAKSIAVLPFANLSDDKQNAYFVEGVQDEILTALAKVADLKVISRMSVMQYAADTRRNLPDIARALGVAHVVEGSVQRVGNRVRVNAQLIDARTDAHMWAEHYDRELADIFAIESELAQQIVAQLRAHLSAKEKAAMEERPTFDIAAHDLYVRAKRALGKAASVRPAENLTEAAQLLHQALDLDPNFFMGYCALASVHDQIYLAGVDHTPSRLAQAQAAIDAALRLRPESGEAHLALADHLYCGYLDYERARAELSIAREALPNEPHVFELTSYIDRRQGRWEESLRNIQRALELDPRNADYLQQIARSYGYLRRAPEEAAALDRALAIVPRDIGVRIHRAAIAMECRADTKPMHAVIGTILQENPNSAPEFADQWFYVAICERDFAAAGRALAAMPESGYTNEGFAYPKTWFEGFFARTRGDTSAAALAFTQARNAVEKTMREQPDYAQALCLLGAIDAALGKKDQAMREGREASALLPVTKESINGSLLMVHLSLIYSWCGEIDLALRQLDATAQIPSPLNYGDLRLNPGWDSLRGDPRFEKIVALLAPAESTR
jgi:TolB-like protein/Tfp pilus assembly protein PilF